jgi:hypothetical protein
MTNCRARCNSHSTKKWSSRLVRVDGICFLTMIASLFVKFYNVGPNKTYWSTSGTLVAVDFWAT